MVALTLMLIGCASAEVASPRDRDTTSPIPSKWILGQWEGSHRLPIFRDRVTFDFREDGETIRWTVHVVRRSLSGSVEHEAEGIVTKISDSSADLDGKFIRSTNTAYVGKPFRYSLTRDQNRLTGGAIGADSQPFTVALRRINRPAEEVTATQKAVPAKPDEPSVRQEGRQLAGKESASAKVGTTFNEGDVLRSKIANVRLMSRPSDNGETITTLSKGEEVIYMGREEDGYLSVEAANGKGWVRKVFVTR